MKTRIHFVLAAMAFSVCTSVPATGLATCDSAPSRAGSRLQSLKRNFPSAGGRYGA